MFNFNELKTIHLEITSRCQASCPMCPRNFHGGLPNPNLVLADWTMDDFVQIFSKEVCDQLTGVYFCGNFGDPIINDNLIDMCQYLKDNCPSINLRIHTNGGARSFDWWKRLREALPNNHVVIFALDGLEDTHHLYRIGTKYETVVRNAQAFINAGGTAEWVFIKFKHNEHQAKEAEKRSKELGFERFSMKNTIRFIGDTKYSVKDKHGEHQYFLEPPDTNEVTLIDKDTIAGFDKWYNETEIECYVQKEKEIYIDAHRNIFPCCFLASAPYNYSDTKDMIKHIKTRIEEQYYELVDSLGGLENLHALNRSVREIIDDPKWQTAWHRYWNENKLITCARVCGKTKMSKPVDQFVKRTSN